MSISRLILWILLTACVAGLVYFIKSTIRYDNRLESWKQAVLADFPIDLSQPGKWNSPLHSIDTNACKTQFILQLSPDQKASRDLLEGLLGFVDIYDQNETRIVRLPISLDFIYDWPIESPYQMSLASCRPWDEGEYELRLSISSPAVRLKGMQQRLIVKYQLCGLEYLPGYIHRAGVAFFGISAAILALYLYSTRNRGAVISV